MLLLQPAEQWPMWLLLPQLQIQQLTLLRILLVLQLQLRLQLVFRFGSSSGARSEHRVIRTGALPLLELLPMVRILPARPRVILLLATTASTVAAHDVAVSLLALLSCFTVARDVAVPLACCG